MVVNTDTNKVEGNYCFIKHFTDGDGFNGKIVRSVSRKYFCFNYLTAGFCHQLEITIVTKLRV